MINIVLRAQLGNLLFQYAFGRHLAIKNNTRLRLITKNYKTLSDPLGQRVIKLLKLFNIADVETTSMVHDSIARKLGVYHFDFKHKLIREDDLGFGFHPHLLELNGEVFLDGFFQSEKYFYDNRDVIKDEIQFKRDYFGEEGRNYKQLIKHHQSVALHVRRGDYLKSGALNVCNINYFKNAIEFFLSNYNEPMFFVFSDDIDWCREYLRCPNMKFVDIPDARVNPVIDMQLMSLCDHQIISNSTYSWWAAWINNNQNKVVVSPYKWFNREDYNESAMIHTIPEQWVKIKF